MLRIAETGIPFVIDEAYVEYAGLEKSYAYLTKKYKNVVVTRTLSKAYGLAGLRFGYALAHKDVIAQISAALLPWNVGIIPMWTALAALEDTEALAERVKFNNNMIEFITTELGKIPGLTVLPSQANYILFDCDDTGKKGSDVVSYAESKGLIFRPNADMYGSSGWFRITIGSKEENQMAVDVVTEFLTK
ncbi:MAG: aminotransferase class I/II-fold pyridoxal phosphate-dependent enzyme [Anaerolineales bacterium]